MTKLITLLFTLTCTLLSAQPTYGPIKTLPPSLDHETQAGIGDLDGDGNTDVIVSENNELKRYEKIAGSDDFVLLEVLATSEGRFKNILLEDMDGDGDLDLVYYNTGGSSLGDDWVILQENRDGMGDLGPQVQIVQSVLQEMQSGDIDGDGAVDLVISPESDYHNMRWYRNIDLQSPFIEQNDFSSTSVTTDAIIIDADLDGDLDVFSIYHASIRLFTNDGTGVFTGERLYSSSGAYNLDLPKNPLMDVDNDGDLDIVFSASGIWDDGLFWHENEGGNYLSHKEIVATEWPYFPIELFDIDHDGDRDFLTLRENGSCLNLDWIENKLNSTGDFDSTAVLITDCAFETNKIKDFLPYDMDGDGDLDLIVFDIYRENNIFWYENFSRNPKVSGYCFFDENQNKLRDSGEIILRGHQLTVEPDAILSAYNVQDEYQFVLQLGFHTITPDLGNHWSLTTDSASYSFILGDTSIYDLNFGYFPNTTLKEVDAQVFSNPTRCGFEVPFWIDYNNNGTSFDNGQIVLTIDPLCSFRAAQPTPTSVQGNQITWDFEDFPPTYNENIRLNLQMPGVDYLGDTLKFEIETFVENDQGVLEANQQSTYSSVLNCAYDPNDKSSTPAGIGEQHLTLFGETFDYKIRFQNTGTDTAFTVFIEDQLDENLDWSTFEFIAASHPCEVQLNRENGEIKFLFTNILLPDSTTNNSASNGFVSYEIKAKDGLEEFTRIENFAEIFFDFNPPILTNTTFNTLVSSLTTSTNSQIQTADYLISPNPFRDYIHLQSVGKKDYREVIFRLINANGVVVKQLQLDHLSLQKIKTNDIPSGLYYYEILSLKSQQLANGKLVKF